MTVSIYWEDLTTGSVRELGTTSVTVEELKEFAGKYDPQPFHLDEEAAKHSMFGGLVASGWHTCALAMRLTVDKLLSHSSSQGSPGLDNLRWLKPVHAGDRLSLRHTILEARPLKSRPKVGLVRSRWEMFNQDGEQVLQMEGYGFFGRRTPATPEELAAMEAAAAGG